MAGWLPRRRGTCFPLAPMSTHAHRPLGRSRGVARSARRFTGLGGLAGLLVASLLVSCGDSGPAEEVVITTELYQRWRDLPHRISRIELTSSPLTEGTGLRVTAQNDGGAAGVFDRPRVRIGADRWASSHLRSVEGSVVVEIPPHDPTMPALHAASVTASVTAPELEGASSVVAYIRGYRIDTNLYDTPPDFGDRIPYDPGYGYTTQGVGIQLGEPSVSGSEITFDVRARNSLGLADRPDMNEAMAEATTWVRVDYVVVGAFGRSNTARGEAEYTLSYATFGTETAHPHATPAAQAVSVAGDAGLPQGLLGLTGFDVWLNVPGHQDPACVEIHSMEGTVAGPGRYLTELSVRLWDQAYDASSGSADAKVDMMLSNSSTFVEVGNLCLGLRGEVGLLQFGGSATVSPFVTETVELPLSRGEPHVFDALFDAL